MTVKEMRQLQIIHQQLGTVINGVGHNNNNDARISEQLKNARECVMDAVMINIEHAFDEGKLFIDNYDCVEDGSYGSI